MKERNSNLLIKSYEESFSKMYVINSMINILKEFFADKEDKALYYGLKKEDILKLSDERNHCINMLSLVSDKISEIMSLFIVMEKEFSSNHYTDNRS